MSRTSHTVLMLLTSVSLLCCGGDDKDTSEHDHNEAAAGSGAGGAEASPSKQNASTGSGGSSAATANGTSGSSPSSSSSTSAPTDESAKAAFDGSFEQCVAALKPVCKYDEKETACGSLTTPVVPLKSGETWGNKEIKSGPYGGFVAWNQGKEFANPIGVAESSCSFVAAAFGEPSSVTDDVLNLRGQDLSLYTIFRPACFKPGEKYPVITWGNGTCGQSGGYASLLASVASHGFVVIASNSRFTDAGNKEMLKALDFAKSLNEDSNSLYYQKLDLEKVGAMGHSQGSSATAHAAVDPRIKAVILFNGGLSSMDKPFLAVSGDQDITNYTPAQMKMGIEAASQPGAFLFYHQILATGGNVTGHLTLMEQPERVVDPTVAWWKYMLKGDETAKKMFVGEDCGLCKDKMAYEFGAHNLP